MEREERFDGQPIGADDIAIVWAERDGANNWHVETKLRAWAEKRGTEYADALKFAADLVEAAGMVGVARVWKVNDDGTIYEINAVEQVRGLREERAYQVELMRYAYEARHEEFSEW